MLLANNGHIYSGADLWTVEGVNQKENYLIYVM